MPPLPIEDYQVAFVCALSKEMTAARAMLDEEHDPYPSQVQHDNNNYVLGRMHGHNVVIACLPVGVYGTVSAATVAKDMLRTFTGIRFGIMMGIGGGVPNVHTGVDIRLGDVVVSQPDGTHGGVVQYDLGKNLEDGVFERKGVLRPPPTLLLTALANLQTRHEIYGNQISEAISTTLQRLPRLAKSGYKYPGADKDVLYCSNIKGHKDGSQCTQCQDEIINREPREDLSPEVHYGIIASGNKLMENVVERDRLGREFGAKCIEMEAAGLMDFPCIVVRGICDYADSHKNDVWQGYAAFTAAGFTKELLSIVKPTEVTNTIQATEAMKYNRGLNLYDAPDVGEELFIGRQMEIQQMAKILQTPNSNRKLLVLGGMGGIGKTQLAIIYAKRYRTYYTSVFWLNATSEVSLKISMRKVAHRVLPLEMVNKLDDEQILAHVSNWFSENENTRWLLIFDNYDEPNHYPIQRYYPSVSHGSIIITTRQPLHVTGVPIELKPFAHIDESLRILATRSGRENAKSALATAGAFLKESALGFKEYLQFYNTRWDRISAKELPDYDRTLYTTWNLSFDQIRQECPEAAQLLAFFAYLDHQDIWFGLFAKVNRTEPEWFNKLISDEILFEEAISTLVKYGLVEAHHDTTSYSLHTCVHDWTLDALNHDINESSYWLAFDCVASHIPVGLLDLFQLFTIQYQRFAGHAKRLTHDHFRVAQQWGSIRSRLDAIHGLNTLLVFQKEYGAAEFICLEALFWCKKVLGTDHVKTLGFFTDLGNLYTFVGKLDEAEEMYLRALAGYKKAPSASSEPRLLISGFLGSLYHKRGMLDAAEALLSVVLAWKTKSLGVNHRSTLCTSYALGVLYRDQGRLMEAEEIFLRALTGSEKVLGTTDPTIITIVLRLADLYIGLDRLEEAEKMLTRALDAFEPASRSGSIIAMYIINRLGVLYCRQGKQEEAEKMLRALWGSPEGIRA